MMKWKNAALVAMVLVILTDGGWARNILKKDDFHAQQWAMLHVQPERVIHRMDRRRLLGTNIGLWHEARQLFDADIRFFLRELHPAFLRIPGGSWSDEYYWNGNGVWDGNDFDLSRLTNGVWKIDFSDYAPGFRIAGVDHHLVEDGFHGNVDVLALHEFAKDKYAHCMVTVNAGSGTPELAAEWVRWANIKHDYNVQYWEIGNELEGCWELGHFLPDGSEITGEIYAHRFVAFARAMKAVDPDIRVGGPAAANDRGGFMEDLLRLAGDQVDFVSFHTYPVEKHLDSEQQIFTQAFSLAQAMQRFRGWIAKYQPERKDEMEIAITEWNSKVIEDRDSASLLNGLWSCLWVGEMFRNRVSFATQWDLLTMTEEGGHGLFYFKDHCIPKSQFWGLYLWSKHMGNSLVYSTLEGCDQAYAFVTRGKDRLQVMIINSSREREARLALDIAGQALATRGRVTTLSQREYFWDYIAHSPRWSHAPESQIIAVPPDFTLTVSPFSVRVFELPFQGAKLDQEETANARETDLLQILLPAEAPADLPIEGWVLVGEGGRDTDKAPDWADLMVKGPARLDRSRVRISEAAGRFFLYPEGPGRVIVKTKAGTLTAEQSVKVVAIHERPEIYWRFENAPAEWGATSTFELRADDRVRPNQQVAAIVLHQATPGQNQDTLLALESMPKNLPRDRIGGVVFDISTSPDFSCTDDGVGVRVILQSEAAHWIELDTLNLKELQGRWETFTFRLPDPKYFDAVGKTYALRFQLYQNSAKKVPVAGTVYLDNVGFLLR